MSKIYQIIQRAICRDSATCDAFLAQKIYDEMGLDGGIYAAQRDVDMSYSGSVRSIDSLPDMADDDIVVYIHRYGSIPNEKLAKLGGKKLLIYHEPIKPEAAKELKINTVCSGLRSAYISAVRAKDIFDGAVAFSADAKKDLEIMGYKCPVALRPVMLAESCYTEGIAEAVPAEMQSEATKNIVYWGKIIPEAKIEDIITIYACYRRCFNRSCRLILASDGDIENEYLLKLKQYAEFLNAEGVVFSLSVSVAKRRAYIRNADAVICGNSGDFPESAAEAAFLGVPVIACNNNANRLIFDESCMLMESLEPDVTAVFIDRLFSDSSFRSELLKLQRCEVEAHSYEKVGGLVRAHINEFIQRCGE